MADIPTREEIEAIVRRVLREELRQVAPSVLSTEQAASLAGMKPKTVRAWIEDGRLKATKRGRVLAIKREDLEAFLAGEGPAPKGGPPTASRLLASLKSTG